MKVNFWMGQKQLVQLELYSRRVDTGRKAGLLMIAALLAGAVFLNEINQHQQLGAKTLISCIGTIVMLIYSLSPLSEKAVAKKILRRIENEEKARALLGESAIALMDMGLYISTPQGGIIFPYEEVKKAIRTPEFFFFQFKQTNYLVPLSALKQEDKQEEFAAELNRRGVLVANGKDLWI